MKTLRNVLAILLLTAVFAQAQDITVQGDRKLNTDFKNYKTYGWLNMDKQNPQVVEYVYEEKVPNSDKRRSKNKGNNKDEYVIYSYGFFVPSEDPAVNSTLTDAVENEMEGRGYKKSSNPDLLLSYKILDSKSKIKGYKNNPTRVPNGEVHQPADTATFAVKGGTVVLSMVDAKTDAVVWEGFASGVAKGSDTVNDKVRIKEAVNLIFSKYGFRADKYTAGNR
jgi:hypothetical protein